MISGKHSPTDADNPQLFVDSREVVISTNACVQKKRSFCWLFVAQVSHEGHNYVSEELSPSYHHSHIKY